MTGTDRPSNFLYERIDTDIEQNKHARVVTRFPPEPNGYLHIGHAKSICLNFGIAEHYRRQGLELPVRCHLRFDDTNPTTEDPEFVESIQHDIRWLGFDWQQHLYFASDYFERFYQVAQKLIRDGHAYIDSSDEQTIREMRGTVTEPGTHSPYRERPTEESLALLESMRRGEHEEGTHVLRAKIDMAAPNMKMRDPLLYRIRKAHHYRTGNDWSIYPLYDFAHCLSDAFESITHSICTLEFENNRELYDWIIEKAGLAAPESKRPRQFEFARLNLSHTVMSKRILRRLVEEGTVDGWDDPRMPTLSGMRRRGYRPQAIRALCDAVGVAKANSLVDFSMLEHFVRDDLNPIAPRVMAVLDPLLVEITNSSEQPTHIEAPYFPEDIGKPGTRQLLLGSHIYIERSDFMRTPPKGFRRLTIGGKVRLRYGYVIECHEAVTDASGAVQKLKCTVDWDTAHGAQPQSGKVKGIIHWVDQQSSQPATFRLYDRLLQQDVPDDRPLSEQLNPSSFSQCEGFVEASLQNGHYTAQPHQSFQFERSGFFITDPKSTEKHWVFNRTVALKDGWAKFQKKTSGQTDATGTQTSNSAPAKNTKKSTTKTKPNQTISDAQRKRIDDYVQAHHIAYEEALVLVDNDTLQSLFESATRLRPEAHVVIARLVVHEIGKLLKQQADTQIKANMVADIAVCLMDETISSAGAKKLVADLHTKGGDVSARIETLGLTQINDPQLITKWVAETLQAHPDAVKNYRDGQTRLKGMLTGKILKASSGRANPKLVQHILTQELDT